MYATLKTEKKKSNNSPTTAFSALQQACPNAAALITKPIAAHWLANGSQSSTAGAVRGERERKKNLMQEFYLNTNFREAQLFVVLRLLV